MKTDSEKMKSTLLIFPFDLLSHYLRCLVIADSLKDHYNILFASGSYDHIVISHGFEVINASKFDAQLAMECAANFDFSWINKESLDEVFISQVNAIKRTQAKIVLGDTSYSLKMAAESTGTFYINLMNIYMSKFYARTRRLPPVHPAYRYLRKLPLHMSDRITSFAEKIAFRSVHKPFRVLRRKYRLKKLSALPEEIEGDLNLLCDTPALFPTIALPPDYYITGPLSYESGCCFELSTNTKPVIYVSMGSTGNWNALSFLNDQAFAEYCIVSSGDKGHVLNASHIIHTDFINPDSVLSRSSLVICHGGNGTVYQALKHEVPVLVRPAHFEQYYNLHALEAVGAGEKISDNINEAASQIARWIWKKKTGGVIPKEISMDIKRSGVHLRDLPSKIYMHLSQHSA